MASENPKGYPEDSELVIGTVDSIFRQGAFITLDEYPGKRGMLHLSEISLKWVRNIRDYVKEGQKVVVQVLKVNPDRGHIDLSLRRVSDHQKKAKLQEVKRRQRAEKLLTVLADELAVDVKDVQEKIAAPLLAEYDTLYDGFEALVADPDGYTSLKLPKKWVATVKDVVGKNIKSPNVSITGFVELTSYESDGVVAVKDTLKKIQGYKADADIDVSVVSAPLYRVRVTAADYKKAEKTMRKGVDAALDAFKKRKGEGEFHRDHPQK